ncbi:hypothetical protein V2J09_007079 [Rumex salicifolius]
MLEHLCNEVEEGASAVLQLKFPWEGSARDYGYEELLHRLYSILSENNPELTGGKRRIVMKPLQVLQEGTGRTIFVNFIEISEILRRQTDHVMAFMLAELGTSGYLDQEQRLVFRGRYAPKNVEAILRRYIDNLSSIALTVISCFPADEYVFCNVCRSPDTILSKDKHLFILGCNLCGFERSLAPNTAGYDAQAERLKIEKCSQDVQVSSANLC